MNAEKTVAYISHRVTSGLFSLLITSMNILPPGSHLSIKPAEFLFFFFKLEGRGEMRGRPTPPHTHAPKFSGVLCGSYFAVSCPPPWFQSIQQSDTHVVTSSAAINNPSLPISFTPGG